MPSDEEVKAQFETNVFGLLTVTRAVLPHMRSRKTGVIANIGSIGGWRTFPGSGPYSATKFAVAGLTDALRQEVAHLGIEATVVDLGAFRTNLVGNRYVAAKIIDDMEPAREATSNYVATMDGKQPGDPAKGAQVLVEVLTKTGRGEGRTLPWRLPLGSDSVPFIEAALESETKSVREWADVISKTDHDDVALPKS